MLVKETVRKAVRVVVQYLDGQSAPARLASLSLDRNRLFCGFVLRGFVTFKLGRATLRKCRIAGVHENGSVKQRGLSGGESGGEKVEGAFRPRDFADFYLCR